MTTAQEALTQIKEQEYFEKYISGNKPVVLVGAAFDRQQKNIGEWLTEELNAG